MPPKELVESEALAQREQQAAQKEAMQPQQQSQQQTQQPTPQELAAQKEQIAQQNSQQQQVAEKPPTMLQKLKDYVESKLPTETVKEVVQTGTKMLKAGVQQASMPDDGAPQRAPETAQAKGQEQTAQIG